MPNETVIIDTPKGKREIPRFVPIKTEAGHHHGKKLEKEYADQNREIEEYLLNVITYKWADGWYYVEDCVVTSIGVS